MKILVGDKFDFKKVRRPSGGQWEGVTHANKTLQPAGWTAILYNINLKTRPCRSTREGSPDVAPERKFLTSYSLREMEYFFWGKVSETPKVVGTFKKYPSTRGIYSRSSLLDGTV